MIKKILTVVGARPQIIKSAAISRAIATTFSNRLVEKVIHTGQHYDQNMSGVFFGELEIPQPYFNLEVGSGSHGSQTAAMLSGIEKILQEEKPEALLVYGDTNSTLAGALAASKMNIPVVHVEAGLRSFNKRMPEEINRIAADHVSTLLLAPTAEAVKNLQAEGLNTKNSEPFHIDNPCVMHCGDVMFDNALHYSKIADEKSDILRKLGLNPGFYLATIHRDANTDNPQRLTEILETLIEITNRENVQLILPMHPRTQKMLQHEEMKEVAVLLAQSKNILITDPVSFLEMISLETHCAMIFTDSGGVQKEAYFFRKPCIILRPQTEWIELVQNGNAIVTDTDKDRIIAAYELLKQKKDYTWPAFYGDGHAAEFICEQILRLF